MKRGTPSRKKGFLFCVIHGSEIRASIEAVGAEYTAADVSKISGKPCGQTAANNVETPLNCLLKPGHAIRK